MNSDENTKKKTWSYRNGLSICFISIFLITLGAQAITGWKVHNSELEDLHVAAIPLATYLCSGHFISATF